jgi:inner membrane protein
VLGALLAILYGILYALMQLEDLALLLGSIGLFLALSAVMITTRKIDWYAAGVDTPPAAAR